MYLNRRTNNCAKDVDIDSCLERNVTGDSAWFVYLFGQNCWFTIYPKWDQDLSFTSLDEQVSFV